MDITTIAREDLADLSHFCNENIEYDQFTPELIEDKSFGDPHFDQENILVGKEEGKIVAFMPGLWKQKEVRRIGWIKWFAVERKMRREGIGSRLLEELEARFRKHRVQEIRISDSAPNYLQPGIDPRNTEAVAFLLRKGYAKTGDFFHMEAKLARQDLETRESEQILNGEGFRFRRLEPGDRQNFMTFLGGEPKEDAYRVDKCYRQQPISCHIAVHGGNVVAYAQYDVDRPGWFGGMRTSEEFRRAKGLGTILFKRCLTDMRRLGYTKALIGWVAPLYFYAKVADARVCRTMWLMTKSL
jgi:GNAT superfamily N-acetyltransferase